MGNPAAILGGFISIIIGLLITFFGYRIFKAYLWVSAFVIGAIATAITMTSNADFSVIAVIVGSLLGGLICAVLIVLFYYIALALIGFALGLLLASILLSPFNADSNIAIGIMIAFGVVGLALIIRYERPAIIVATSYGGAGQVVAGIILIFGLDEETIQQFIKTADGSHLEALLLIGLWIVLFGLGVRFQLEEDDDRY